MHHPNFCIVVLICRLVFRSVEILWNLLEFGSKQEVKELGAGSFEKIWWQLKENFGAKTREKSIDFVGEIVNFSQYFSRKINAFFVKLRAQNK